MAMDSAPVTTGSSARAVELNAEQRAALEAMEATLREGGVLNVLGAFGSGKSTVGLAFVEAARARGDHVFTLDACNRPEELPAIAAGVVEAQAARRVLVIDNWDLARVAEQDIASLQRTVHDLAHAGPGHALVILSQRPADEAEEHERGIPLLGVWRRARVVTLSSTFRGPTDDSSVPGAVTRLAGAAQGAALGALTASSVGTLFGAALFGGLAGAVVAAAAAKFASAPAGRGDRRLSARFMDPAERARSVAAFVAGLRKGRNEGREDLGWLRELLGTDGAALDDATVRATIEARADRALVAWAWEQFVRDLVLREPSVGKELTEAGCALDPDRATLPAFLDRTRMTPAELLANLLRPSDLRRFFPSADHDRGKIAVLEQAIARWQRGESA